MPLVCISLRARPAGALIAPKNYGVHALLATIGGSRPTRTGGTLFAGPRTIALPGRGLRARVEQLPVAADARGIGGCDLPLMASGTRSGGHGSCGGVAHHGRAAWPVPLWRQPADSVRRRLPGADGHRGRWPPTPMATGAERDGARCA
jgi:hypothetical protein